MIDWSKEIEAVHQDGRVFPVTVRQCHTEPYETNECPDGSETNEYWHADGKDWCYLGDKWTIRNVVSTPNPTPDERAVAPELVKHMLDSWKAMAKFDAKDVGPHFAANWIETAKAIVAESENPDITEACNLIEGMNGASDEDIVLAAIKRGRQLEKEGK